MASLSEYFAGNDNDSGVSQWAGGWQALSWSGKDIRIILEDDSRGYRVTKPA